MPHRADKVADILDDAALYEMRQRARVIQLLDAAERAGIAPLPAARLHAFAYLADVLSPVWHLPPFDGKILKIEGGPHYPDLQAALDRMTVLGLVEITNLRYVDRPNEGARIEGMYGLRFESPYLHQILSALGADEKSDPFDSRDRELHSFLIELATALGTLPDDEIEVAATEDATYADDRIAQSNIVDFASWVSDWHDANLSVRAADRFQTFLPQGTSLSSGEKVYLYASFLSRRMHVAK